MLALERRSWYSCTDSLDGLWYSTVIFDWRRLEEGDWWEYGFWSMMLCGELEDMS